MHFPKTRPHTLKKKRKSLIVPIYYETPKSCTRFRELSLPQNGATRRTIGCRNLLLKARLDEYT